MHKAGSTFVADVLFNSLARRTALYDLFHVGSFLIRYVKQQQESNGMSPAKSPQERQEQLEAFLHDTPIPQSNGLIGRLYPGHMSTIEKVLEEPLPNEGNKLLVMRRDPRDALISLYFSMALSHNPNEVEGDNAAFLKNREDLMKHRDDVRQGIKELLTKPGMDSTMPEFLHCTDLILQNDDVIDLPYELMINDPYLWLAKFVDGTEMTDVVDECWMDEMAENLRPPSVEDPNCHKRRMKPGNWMEIFDDELKQIVSEKLGDRLTTFGYQW